MNSTQHSVQRNPAAEADLGNGICSAGLKSSFPCLSRGLPPRGSEQITHREGITPKASDLKTRGKRLKAWITEDFVCGKGCEAGAETP
jgi:hypothetical protein